MRMPTGPIAIFAALRWECQPVLRHLQRVRRVCCGTVTTWRGHAGGREVWLVKTGIGPQRAAAAAEAVGALGRFAVFVSTGCAGALAGGLQPGDLTLASAVVAVDADGGYASDPGHHAWACRAAGRATLRAVTGPVLCSPVVLASAAAKAAAAARGPIAVEMEGAPIAAAAAAAGIPFVSVRAILDTAETELAHAGRFIEPSTGAVKPVALATYLAAHPGAVHDLLAMRRMMRAADASLDRFFGAWFADAVGATD
jgi:nucleoside phosphorylase